MQVEISQDIDKFQEVQNSESNLEHCTTIYEYLLNFNFDQFFEEKFVFHALT